MLALGVSLECNGVTGLLRLPVASMDLSRGPFTGSYRVVLVGTLRSFTARFRARTLNVSPDLSIRFA